MVEALLAIVVFPTTFIVQADSNIKSLAYAMLASLAAVGALVLLDGVFNLIAAPWRLHGEAVAVATGERTELTMTIHELTEQLEDKRSREEIASGLVELYNEAEKLMDGIAADGASQPQTWEQQQKQWIDKVTDYIRNNVGTGTAVTWTEEYSMIGADVRTWKERDIGGGDKGRIVSQFIWCRSKLSLLINRYSR